MIEFLSAMTALDFLLILVWVGVIFYGIRAGMVKVLFLIAAVVVGALGGAALARPLSTFTGPWAGVSADRGLPVTYFALALLIMTTIFVLLILTYRKTNVTRNVYLEGVLGAGVGFLGGLVLVTQLTGMTLVVTNEQWAYMDGARTNVRLEMQNTPFLPLLADTFPNVTKAIEGWLPVSTDDSCPRCL
jgi:uncharacterized membrane protein required for colicin V production